MLYLLHDLSNCNNLVVFLIYPKNQVYDSSGLKWSSNSLSMRSSKMVIVNVLMLNSKFD